MGLTNHILPDIMLIVVHRLPWGGGVKNSQLKVVKLNQEIILINLYQIIELMKSNQRIEIFRPNKIMGLIKSSQDIQSWHIAIFAIMTDGMALNCDKQDTKSFLWILFWA